jgi:hypothetical protein
MKKFILSVGFYAAALLAMATPAHAITFISGAPSTTQINYSGTVEDTLVSGLTAQQVLNFLGTTYNSTTNRTVFRFSYELTNTSSSPITASRISGFGFSSTPMMAAATATGLFDNAYVKQDTNVPVFDFTADTCFHSDSQKNCSGNGGEGVTMGQSTTGGFTLSYVGNIASMTLDDFFVRYQSIEGAGLAAGSSGVGVGIESAVPEPATWALMLFGFGAVGYSMRRRKPYQLQQAV